ncbi:hypothetical protein SH2C18_31150 [Clostridium sediminicola]|uniref:hypothetical protein n=1 Tax=Clostridium sediminicola TaxID=3114879 RepID=UPI0031F2781B
MLDIEIFKVTIDHFRGYRKEEVFDFEDGSDVIILAGPNGYGKTSVFDAIEWGFTGKLSRFDEPNEEKNNSCFINFQPFESTGTVYIEFGNKKNRYLLKRESKYSLTESTDYSYKKSIVCITGSDIETMDNEKAKEFLNNLFIKDEWRDKIDFTDVFKQYHTLTQDKIKKFIQGIKGPDRYKQVSMMVGTQGFYAYKYLLERKRKLLEHDLNELIDRKSKLEIKINSKREMVNRDIKINMGDCQTVESWIYCLIDKYNKIIEKLNMKSYCVDNNLNPLNIISSIKEHAIQTHEKMKYIQNQSLRLKEKLNDVEYNLKLYNRNKSELKMNQEIIPLVERGHQLLWLQKQLPTYSEYNEFSRKNQISLLKVSNELKQTQMFLLKLTTLHNQIDFIIKEIKLENCIDDSIEKRIKSEIKLLENNTPRFDDANEITINNNVISIVDYKQEIDMVMKSHVNLNDLIKVSVENYKENIESEVNTYSIIEKDTLQIEENVKEIDNNIKKLSIVEEELNKILSEALGYIKHANDTNSKVVCPVCSSDFERNELIKIIESKLVQDNSELSSSIGKRERLEKKLKSFQYKLNESKERYNKYNKDFVEELENIKNAIVLLGKNIRRKEYNYDDEYKMLNENQTKERQKYNNIIEFIKSMSLSIDINKLERELTIEINKINNLLNQRGLSLLSLHANEIKNDIENTKQKICTFEKKAAELRIKMDNLEEDIKYKTLDVNSKINSVDNLENELKYLNERFLETHQELYNSEVNKELKVLVKQYNEMSKQAKENNEEISILGKLIDASTEAIQEISQHIIMQHQEFINNIYRRVNPHPLFTEIEFNFNKNNKGSDILNINCINKKLKNKVNPAFTFSSAQVNVVAVSIFLGMALRQQCSNLKTIMLDDPIQNMDDLNVISFIDVLRNFLSTGNEENKKQIIISTHDQDFHRLMVKKFRFVPNKSFEFISYNNNGPVLMRESNIK